MAGVSLDPAATVSPERESMKDTFFGHLIFSQSLLLLSANPSLGGRTVENVPDPEAPSVEAI